jgi:predicted alpha/beta-hydrolase family hydrolase
VEELATPLGPAQVELDAGADPGFLLVLTHGAGGGIGPADLLAAAGAARGLGGAVARVLQPYRVAGRRLPGAAADQDRAWLAVVEALAARHEGLPLVLGGRSNGARVACRTALAAGAAGVLALAFPLRPPWAPGTSRMAELDEAGVEVLCVSGERDPFGVPGPGPGRQVRVLAGQGHALDGAQALVGAAVAGWLGELLARAR